MAQTRKSLDKPVGREIGWQRQSTHYPFVDPKFKVRQDQIQLPDGQVVEYPYLESQGGLWIVPVTQDGRVILIRQYRYPSDDWCWQVPTGGLCDHSGSLEELARRELAEEIGARCVVV